MKKTQQRFQVEIASHETNDKKVYYNIKVTNLDNKAYKIIKKRYSELESIHFKIMDWINIFKIKINNLTFPKKAFFFSTNQSEESIIKRRAELQTYFNEIFAHPELQCLGALDEFLPANHKKPVEQQQAPITQLSEIQELKRSYLNRHGEGDGGMSLPSQTKLTEENQQYIFKFEDHIFVEDYAVYTIQVTDTIVNRSWRFSLRYKELKDYHKQLKKLKFDVPIFPEKKVINSFSTYDLKDRKTQLEIYLNNVFKIQDIVHSDLMIYFIAKSQLEGNEIGCRSKGSQTTLENSSCFSHEQWDDMETKQPRKITC